MPPFTEMLILQPTPFCNLDCHYCYLPDRSSKKRMSREVVEATFSKVLPSDLVGHALTIVWHAGEPLTVPLSWYEEAYAIAEAHRPPGLKLKYAFQSNGTLLDLRWAEFLRRTGSTMSLSIDGPSWLHDAQRRTRGGKGTHALAMRGLRILQEAGLASSVITVLTAVSLTQADALFDFYAAAGITDVAFNVEELEGMNTAPSLDGGEVEAAYETFLRGFIARMLAAPDVLGLREWRDANAVLRLGVADGFNQEAEPMRILSVTADGAISTFSPELLGFRHPRYDDFVFGNVLTDSVALLIRRVMESSLLADIRTGIGHCQRTCGWFDWCGGGAPSNKIFETGTAAASETAYCRLTRKTLLEMVLSVLERGQVTHERVNAARWTG